MDPTAGASNKRLLEHAGKHSMNVDMKKPKKK